MFLAKMPAIVKKFYSKFEWDGSLTQPPCIYLTFDDGPHPTITPWVIEQLAQYDAQATFFCVGENVLKFPETFELIKHMGHTVGNHTYNHLRGYNTDHDEYIENVAKADQLINSKLFRPPHGRIKSKQANTLIEQGYRIIMWSIIAGDWDRSLDPQRCLENIIFNLEPGNIVVLHDSEKSWDRMNYVLPRLLEHCKNEGLAVRCLIP